MQEFQEVFCWVFAGVCLGAIATLLTLRQNFEQAVEEEIAERKEEAAALIPMREVSFDKHFNGRRLNVGVNGSWLLDLDTVHYISLPDKLAVATGTGKMTVGYSNGGIPVHIEHLS